MSNPLNLKIGDLVRLKLDAEPHYKRRFIDGDLLRIVRIDKNDPRLTYRLENSRGICSWVYTEDIIPVQTTSSKLCDRIKAVAEGVRDCLGIASDKATFTSNLPLLDNNKLLTHIEIN